MPDLHEVINRHKHLNVTFDGQTIIAFDYTVYAKFEFHDKTVENVRVWETSRQRADLCMAQYVQCEYPMYAWKRDA